jgi:hypothetical protein
MTIGLLWKREVLSIFVKSKDQILIFFQMIPKKLTPNFYAVTDGSFTEVWDSIGSYIGVPFSVKHPSWGFTLPLTFYQILTFLWRERERSSKENNQQ